MGQNSLLARLGAVIKEAVRTTPSSEAGTTTTVGGKTETEVRQTATPASVGLSEIRNFSPPTLAEAIAGTAEDKYSNTSGVDEYIKASTAHLKGNDGDCFFLNDVTLAGLIPARSMGFLSVITTQAELDTMLSVEEKMGDVFNSWKKISRGKWNSTPEELKAFGLSDNAIPAELAAFTYDAATDKIKNPMDTLSLVGFVSPNAFQDYVLDVVLKSDSVWQNDPMGLILGYTQDPDGRTHTLTAMFNPWGPGIYGGADAVVTIMVDYNTSEPVRIHSQREHLHWVDGQPATGNMLPTEHPYGVKPWVQATNGARLRITRAGDVFTVEMTEYDSTVFVDAAKFSFNLDSHPALARFKGPQRYGYAAISQDLANWNVITRPGARQAIVDIRDKTVREWDGTKWVLKSDAWSQYIEPNRFYYNRTTKRLYYAENETTLLPIL